jgi:hypothetical protein
MLLVVGCASNDRGGKATEDTSQVVWLELLERLPVTEETLRGPLIMNDYAVGREIFSAALPPDSSAWATLEQYYVALMTDLPPTFYPHGYYPAAISGFVLLLSGEDQLEKQSRAWLEELGFSFLAVDQDLSVGVVNPPIHRHQRSPMEG